MAFLRLPFRVKQKGNKTILARAKQLLRSLGFYSTKEKQFLAAATSVFSFLGIEIHTPMECRWWSNLGLFEAPSKKGKNHRKQSILDSFLVQHRIYFGKHVERHFCVFVRASWGFLGCPSFRKSSWLQPGAFSRVFDKNGYVDGGPMVSQLGPGILVEFEKQSFEMVCFTTFWLFSGTEPGASERPKLDHHRHSIGVWISMPKKLETLLAAARICFSLVWTPGYKLRGS